MEQLAQLPPACDPAPLTEAIRQARSQGNLSQQAATLRAEIAALTKQASIDLNKLGLWSGTLEVLEKLALPAAETIARFDRNLTDAQARIAGLNGQLEKARGDAADIQRDLERLRLEGEVPSEAELTATRKLRDAGWRLVLQEWRKEAIESAALEGFLASVSGTGHPLAGRVPLGAGTRSVPDTLDLAAAYEQIVRRADDLSDRLRREANRVANRATLQAQQLSLQQQTTELGRQQAAAAEQLQQIEAQWRQTWHPAGIDPLPPREMQAWIQRQQGLVQQAQMLRQRTASLEQLEEQIAAHCQQLHDLLPDPLRRCPASGRGAGGEGIMFPSPSGRGAGGEGGLPSFDSLLARGDSILEQINGDRPNRGDSWSGRKTAWRRPRPRPRPRPSRPRPI